MSAGVFKATMLHHQEWSTLLNTVEVRINNYRVRVVVTVSLTLLWLLASSHVNGVKTVTNRTQKQLNKWFNINLISLTLKLYTHEFDRQTQCKVLAIQPMPTASPASVVCWESYQNKTPHFKIKVWLKLCPCHFEILIFNYNFSLYYYIYIIY